MKNQVSPIFYPFQIKGQGMRESRTQAAKGPQRDSAERSSWINRVSHQQASAWITSSHSYCLYHRHQWPPKNSQEQCNLLFHMRRGAQQWHGSRGRCLIHLGSVFLLPFDVPSQLFTACPLPSATMPPSMPPFIWPIDGHRLPLSCPKQAHLWPNLLPVSNTAMFLFYSMTNPSISTLSTSS